MGFAPQLHSPAPQPALRPSWSRGSWCSLGQRSRVSPPGRSSSTRGSTGPRGQNRTVTVSYTTSHRIGRVLAWFCRTQSKCRLKSLEKALLGCTRVIWPLANVETGATLSSGCVILRQDDEGISSLLFFAIAACFPVTGLHTFRGSGSQGLSANLNTNHPKCPRRIVSQKYWCIYFKACEGM